MDKGCRSVVLMEPYRISLQMQLGEGNRQVVTRRNILYPNISCLQAPVSLSASRNILAVIKPREDWASTMLPEISLANREGD